jgi:ABC-type antimicrobial peptide transport system permease subunit
MRFSFRNDMPAEAVYLPYAQAPADLRGQAEIEVSTVLDPASMIPAIRNQVHSLANDLPPIKIVSADQYLQESENREERSLTQLLVGFGVLALGLALLGLYGTVSYSVSQRLRELAIRIALGARHRELFRMIVGESLRYVLLGAVLGVALAIGASHAVESFLFEVRGFDPVTYGVLTFVLILTAMVAAYIPARRARRIDPMLVVRCE